MERSGTIYPNTFTDFVKNITLLAFISLYRSKYLIKNWMNLLKIDFLDIYLDYVSMIDIAMVPLIHGESYCLLA